MALTMWAACSASMALMSVPMPASQLAWFLSAVSRSRADHLDRVARILLAGRATGKAPPT